MLSTLHETTALTPPPAAASRAAADAHLREVLALHLHPKHGSRYWLQTEQRLGWSIRDRIRSIADLAKLGTRDAAELRGISAWDFVPRGLHRDRQRFFVGETGGTSGQPAATAYDADDFHAAFVAPFEAAARQVGFPRGLNWLFVGPSGPHLIGKAARELARASASADPWTVDFDPRWVRTLASPLARQRYLQHVVSQACDVMAREEIGVLFTTPPVLQQLCRQLDHRQREQLRGIHYGGLALTAQAINDFRHNFPNAVHLAGYGNTLFGCALEGADGPREAIDYFPHGPRLLFEVIEPHDPDRPEHAEATATSDRCPATAPASLSAPASTMPSEDATTGHTAQPPRGQVVFHRIDRSCLLLGIRERDWAQPIPLSTTAQHWGACGIGLRNPATPPSATPTIKTGGIY